jgi:lipopolysaccharide export LptBFGC system permease protein LptF
MVGAYLAATFVQWTGSFLLGVGLAFYGMNALAIALGKGGWLPPLLAAWGVPIAFSILGLRLTWRRLA